MSKKKINLSGIVYSTDPEFNPLYEESEEQETISPAEQKLKIRLETKHRGGKTVTFIDGFIGKQADKEELIKKIKNHCGTGGSAKDGELLIQGDQREKIFQWLQRNGYGNTKKNH